MAIREAEDYITITTSLHGFCSFQKHGLFAAAHQIKKLSVVFGLSEFIR